MVETRDGEIRGKQAFQWAEPWVLPVTEWETSDIAALSAVSWNYVIPDDDFTWYLAEFSSYTTPTGYEVVRLAIDGVDIYRNSNLFMASYPDYVHRPFGIDLGAFNIPSPFISARARRPYMVATGSTVLITIANIHAYQRTNLWIMTFYRSPA